MKKKSKIKGKCSNCRVRFMKTNTYPSVRKVGYGLCNTCSRRYWIDWGIKNKDVRAERGKKQYKRNIKVIKVQHREYYNRNRKEVLKRSALNYRKNKKAILLRMKRRRETPSGRYITLLKTLQKERVSKKDLLWNFNFYFNFINEQRCHYCGGMLNPGGHGLDCVDSNQKHFCWNVVPCCWGCNKIKRNELSYQEMMLLSPGLNIIRKQREGQQ